MNPEAVAEILNTRNNEHSDVPLAEGVRKMTPEQIRNRRRSTVNNLAERQMFGIASNNYKNKLKK